MPGAKSVDATDSSTTPRNASDTDMAIPPRSIGRTRTVVDGFILPEARPVVRQGRNVKRRSMPRQIRSNRFNLVCLILVSSGTFLYLGHPPTGTSAPSAHFGTRPHPRAAADGKAARGRPDQGLGGAVEPARRHRSGDHERPDSPGSAIRARWPLTKGAAPTMAPWRKHLFIATSSITADAADLLRPAPRPHGHHGFADRGLGLRASTWPGCLVGRVGSNPRPTD